MGDFVQHIVTMEMTTRMIRINKGLALAASLTAVVVGLGTGVAFASAETDTDNVNPANTAFTAGNSSNILFKGNVDGNPITVTCTVSGISGTTPATGLGPVNISNPIFGSSAAPCKDSAGGTDTITTNSTNGPWQLTFVDLANDEGIVIGATTDEPAGHAVHTGDQIKITIPKAGAKFTSTALSGCTITAAPGGPASITGAYDDVNRLAFSSASFTVSGSGCFASSSAISGSYQFTPDIQDVSS
jgi:hypothetical protein